MIPPSCTPLTVAHVSTTAEVIAQIPWRPSIEGYSRWLATHAWGGEARHTRTQDPARTRSALTPWCRGCRHASLDTGFAGRARSTPLTIVSASPGHSRRRAERRSSPAPMSAWSPPLAACRPSPGSLTRHRPRGRHRDLTGRDSTIGGRSRRPKAQGATETHEGREENTHERHGHADRDDQDHDGHIWA